jgi:hypothetical protein
MVVKDFVWYEAGSGETWSASCYILHLATASADDTWA